MTSRHTIAELNDLLRETFLTGRIVLTNGISLLRRADRQAIITKVRTFDAFSLNNDPYGEHDFGSIDHDGVGRIFWKIDCYEQNYQCLSSDPSDPKLTSRVLTIMLAEEY